MKKRKIQFELSEENEKKLQEIARAYSLETISHAMRHSITLAHALTTKQTRGIAPAIVAKPTEKAVTLAALAQGEPKQRGRKALTYAEKQEQENQKAEEKKEYEYEQCRDCGGDPQTNGCHFDRYERHGGRVIKWAGQIQPYYEVTKPYFRNWVLGGFESKEQAEKQYQKESAQRAKENAEALAQKEKDDATMARIQRERLARVDTKELEEIATTIHTKDTL